MEIGRCRCSTTATTPEEFRDFDDEPGQARIASRGIHKQRAEAASPMALADIPRALLFIPAGIVFIVEEHGLHKTREAHSRDSIWRVFPSRDNARFTLAAFHFASRFRYDPCFGGRRKGYFRNEG